MAQHRMLGMGEAGKREEEEGPHHMVHHVVQNGKEGEEERARILGEMESSFMAHCGLWLRNLVTSHPRCHIPPQLAPLLEGTSQVRGLGSPAQTPAPLCS